MDAEFDEIEREIEELHERIGGCRRAIVLARGALVIAFAALALVILVAPAYRTPAVVLGTIATMIGGTVWWGTSASSREQAETALAAAEARRDTLFDAVVTRNGWRETSTTLH